MSVVSATHSDHLLWQPLQMNTLPHLSLLAQRPLTTVASSEMLHHLLLVSLIPEKFCQLFLINHRDFSILCYLPGPCWMYYSSQNKVNNPFL